MYLKSETDTEVIPQLLEDLDDGDFLSTVFKMRAKVKGSYAFGILRQDTNELIGTRKESPLNCWYWKRWILYCI